MNLLHALSRASKRTQYHPIAFDVTLLTEPYTASERVIWGGLVVTGAYARVGGDYSLRYPSPLPQKQKSPTGGWVP